MRKLVFGAAGLALLAAVGLASMATVSGADHRDSPLNIANPTADINDVYAFRSPENPNNVVVVLSVNPLIAPSDNAARGQFDGLVQYQVHVDRNADLLDDATVIFRVTTSPQTIVVENPGPFTVPVTAPGATQPQIVTFPGGIKFFAGLRDDPFFFDLVGFQAFLANPQAPARGLRPASGGTPTDSFAGTNILAIVAEIPVTALTGGTSATSGTIRVWASSTRGGNRIDRMAIPAINTALIPTAQKDAFNLADPSGDASRFRPVALTQINALRRVVDGLFGNAQGGGPLGNLLPEQVAATLIPDVVTLDFSRPLQFPNGRRLQDDVIDAALGVVLNRGGAAGISDGVDANDRAFSSSFPYLADPHRAAAPAAPGISAPRTGDGGLIDTGTMWALSGGLFALAVALGAGGVFAAMRRR